MEIRKWLDSRAIIDCKITAKTFNVKDKNEIIVNKYTLMLIILIYVQFINVVIVQISFIKLK